MTAHAEITVADRSPLPKALITALSDMLGNRLSTRQAVREEHGRGEGPFSAVPPDAVAFAESTGEVSAIVGLCAGHGVPVIAFGTGTSLEGHVLALKGGSA